MCSSYFSMSWSWVYGLVFSVLFCNSHLSVSLLPAFVFSAIFDHLFLRVQFQFSLVYLVSVSWFHLSGCLSMLDVCFCK